MDLFYTDNDNSYFNVLVNSIAYKAIIDYLGEDRRFNYTRTRYDFRDLLAINGNEYYEVVISK